MLEEVYTWVGDVYAVHTVIKSQTGYMMSMDWGTLHCKFIKHNLNMKISTESKLIRTSDYVPYYICLRTGSRSTFPLFCVCSYFRLPQNRHAIISTNILKVSIFE